MTLKHLRTRGVLYLLAASMGLAAAAQLVRENRPERTVSREEGEAIVQTAWELRKGLGPKPDCSHFVHEVYLHAGLDYEYANSIAIFAGIGSFRRVQRPQPGDLIVWPGHVGIMIDPSEHSFYSSVVKGFAIEDYSSRYWVRRGHPRFYRYLVDETHSAQLRTKMASASTESVSRTLVSKKSLDQDTSPSYRTGVKASALEASDEIEPGDAELLDTIFVSSSTRPTKADVRSAFVRVTGSNAARALRIGLPNSQTVGIVDEFNVLEMHVQGRFGWAGMEIRETATIENGRAIHHRRTTQWRLALRHDAQGWMMLVPHDKTCLPRDQAIQALTDHLARVSHEAENEQELKRTVRVLDDLLAGETRYVPVSGSGSE